VSGAHAPMLGVVPGDSSRLPDPSELYVLPRMPYDMAYSPAAAERMLPVLITAAVQTTSTTTITSTVAASAAQSGLVYTSFIGPRALTSGMYAIRPMYGAADHQYQASSMFASFKPRRVRVSSSSSS